MAKRKRPKIKSIDEQHMGPEPGKDYFANKGDINKFYAWYTYMFKRQDRVRIVSNFAKQFGFKNTNKFSKMYIPSTTAAMVRGIENEVDFPQDLQIREKLFEQLRSLNKKAQNLKAEDIDKAAQLPKRKTVQENIQAKALSFLGEVDHAIDMWDVQRFDMYSYLTDEKVTGAVAKSMINAWDDMIKEIIEAIEGDCKQLKEGYSYMTLSQKKDYRIFLEKIKSDTQRYADNNKPIRKPRRAKQINAVKAVKKLNYIDHDPENQVKSIDPSKIIGSQQLWVFNGKTNEIIKYDASDRGGLMVTGTTIKNFNPKSSASKKLGVKTELIINRVLDGGKIVLNKVMSEISSKSCKVTGRINNNMILLKVE